MATRRYKISAGETVENVVEEVGAATNSDTVEVTVDLATDQVNLDGANTRAINKEEVLRALDLIKEHILKGDWLPA